MARWIFDLQKGEFHRQPVHRRSSNSVLELDDAGFFQGAIGAVFIDRLETARGDANPDKFLQLRHPNALPVQVWREDPRDMT